MEKQKDSKQTITLTGKQFIALLKVVYLGNWMVNAYRTEDMKKEYEGVEDYIFSLAPQFGLEKYMDHETSDGDRYYPTSFFEETTDVRLLIEEYDEEMFWDELAESLGKRDFVKMYSRKEIEKMSREKYFDKLYEHIDNYIEEFEKFGLQRIRIQKQNKPHIS